MELLLNLLWIAIGVTAVIRAGLWANQQPDTAASRRRIRLVLVATMCAVALMFPIISMTDDMDAKAALVEEAITAKRLVNASNELGLPLVLASAFLASLLTTRVLLGNVVETSPSPLPAAIARVFSLRGPPARLC